MSKRRTTMAALDWSIEYMKDIKRSMVTLEGKKQEAAWAIGGVLVAITSHLLMTSQEILHNSTSREGANAKDDLIAIKTKMLEFFDKMLAD